MMNFEVSSENDWVQVLGPWLETLKAGDLVLLKGPMAAGKTTFVRAAMKFWGFEEVASPTYALHHRYEKESSEGPPAQKSLKVDHWDLYRLKNADDLETTSFWDLLSEKDSIVFIEWPDLVAQEQWPRDRRIFVMEISKQKASRKVHIRPL